MFETRERNARNTVTHIHVTNTHTDTREIKKIVKKAKTSYQEDNMKYFFYKKKSLSKEAEQTERCNEKKINSILIGIFFINY